MHNKAPKGFRPAIPGQPSAYALLLIVAMLALAGCTQAPGFPAKPSLPADMPAFTFDPIAVEPGSPVASQAFNISMRVTNTGTAAGTYRADLIINGNSTDNRELHLDPGKSGSLAFQASVPIPGQYVVKIGPQSKEIVVGFNRVPVTIRVDTGNVDGFDALAGSTGQWGSMVQTVEGYLIKLTALPGGFEIGNIDVFGYIKSSDHDFNSNPVTGGSGTWVYGSDIAAIEPVNPNFTITIWDARKNRLFSGDFSKGLFDYYPRWVSIPVPGVHVSGDFYVELVTHNQPKLNGMGWGGWDHAYRYVVHSWYYQLCLGYENSLDVRSWVSQNGGVVPDRFLTYNWLMRARGYQLQSQDQDIISAAGQAGR